MNADQVSGTLRGRSVRSECLDHILIFGRHHLEQILRGSVTHYKTERPHRSLALTAAPRWAAVGAWLPVLRDPPPRSVGRADPRVLRSRGMRQQSGLLDCP
jgi:hypothetical protein